MPPCRTQCFRSGWPELGDERLKCRREELFDALRAHRRRPPLAVLKLSMERLEAFDQKIQELDKLVAQELNSTRMR